MFPYMNRLKTRQQHLSGRENRDAKRNQPTALSRYFFVIHIRSELPTIAR